MERHGSTRKPNLEIRITSQKKLGRLATDSPNRTSAWDCPSTTCVVQDRKVVANRVGHQGQRKL